MKTTRTDSLTPEQAEALQARFAQRLSARLDEGAQQLPHDIAERLRVARQQAVAAAQAQRGLAARPAAAAGLVTVASPAGLALAGAGGAGGASMPGLGLHYTARRGGRLDDRNPDDDHTSWLVRLASLLPLLALLAGLWGINHWAHREQVQAAAEVDTALLTDDLPPAAYADPGFEEYLLSSGGTAIDAAAATSLDQAVPEGTEPASPDAAPPATSPVIDGTVSPADVSAAG